MKCLSLIQPWAALVILGAKHYETRGWHTDYRGRLAIHASRTFPDAARALCLLEPYRSVLRAAGFHQSADLPRGALLGTVALLDCLPASELLPRLPEFSREAAFGDYRSGRWAWKLDDPIRYDVPLSCRGRLGLFEVPQLVEENAPTTSLSIWTPNQTEPRLAGSAH
jgi:hypothetical protein